MIDTLLVAVLLTSTGQQMMLEAVLTADSTLVLPSHPVAELLGIEHPTRPWTTLAELRQRFPPITVEWYPRELRVVIHDPLLVLPASRRARTQREQRAQRALPLTTTRSGPFFALTGADDGRQLYEGGYSWKGQIALSGAWSSTRGARWGLSLMPSRYLYVTYADARDAPPLATARVLAGPAWVAASWHDDELLVDALASLGCCVAVFVSPMRETYAFTIRGPVTVQVARTGQRSSARLYYGPAPPSPFSLPTVP